MYDLINRIKGLLNEDNSFVLTSIISSVGSTPRTAGTKMLVMADGEIFGTIGGGIIEANVINTAKKLFFSKDKNSLIENFKLTDKNKDGMDMICGGELNVLIEFIEPNEKNKKLFYNAFMMLKERRKSLLVAELIDFKNETFKIIRYIITDEGVIEKDSNLPASLIDKIKSNESSSIVTLENRNFIVDTLSISGTVFIFGAGHVSRQLAKLTSMTGFYTIVLDDRKEFANSEKFKTANEIRVLESFENAFEKLKIDNDSYIVIMTRGHLHDKTVLRKALKTDAKYIGMIGSERKRNNIYNDLMNEGFTKNDINRVKSPIGLPIGAETPEEIAVSVIAELIKLKKTATQK